MADVNTIAVFTTAVFTDFRWHFLGAQVNKNRDETQPMKVKDMTRFREGFAK